MSCQRINRSESDNSNAIGNGKPLRPGTHTPRHCHSQRAVFLFVTLLVATTSTHQVQAQELAFSIKCASLVTTRLDPIETEGACADHVNSAFGAVNFGASVNPAAFQQESSVYTTCSTPFDRSMYWVPALYYGTSGDVLSLVEVSDFSVDYIRGRKSLLTFPVNFRQRAGATSGLWPVSAPEDEAESQTSWQCITQNGDEETPSASWRDLPSRGCSKLVAQVTFPSCLTRAPFVYANNGKLVSDAAYPERGLCPESHGYQVPALRYNVVYNLGSDWDLRNLVLSTGDRSGSDMHGDFISGWDPYVLESSMTYCEDAGSGHVTLPGIRCPLAQHIGTHVQGPMTFSRPLARKYDVPAEEVDNMLSLPLASTSSCAMLSSMPQAVRHTSPRCSNILSPCLPASLTVPFAMMFQEKDTEDADSSEKSQEPERPITVAPDTPDSSDETSDAVPPQGQQGSASEEEPQDDSSDSEESVPPSPPPVLAPGQQGDASEEEPQDDSSDSMESVPSVPPQGAASSEDPKDDSSDSEESVPPAPSAKDVQPAPIQDSEDAAPPQAAPAIPQDNASSDEAGDGISDRDSSEGDSSTTAASSATDVIPDSSKTPTAPVKKPVPAWCKRPWCGRTDLPAPSPSSSPKPPSTPDAKPVPSWCKFAWCGRTTPPAAPEPAKEDANASPQVPEVPTSTSKAPSTPGTKPVPSWCKYAWCGRTDLPAAPEEANEGANSSAPITEIPSSDSEPPKSNATAESPEVANPPTTDQGCEGDGCGQNQTAAAPPVVVSPGDIEDMELPCFGVACGRSSEAANEPPKTHIDYSHTASQESEIKNPTISLPPADADNLDDVGIKDKTGVVADRTLPDVDNATDDEWVLVDNTKESSSRRMVAAGITLHLCLVLAYYSYYSFL